MTERERARSRWKNMRQRCNNPKSSGYPGYGARGIKVCKRWSRFANFIADMGMPKKGQQLDRIDNDGPYSPANCRWTTPSENSRNRRSTKINQEIADQIRFRVLDCGHKTQHVADDFNVSRWLVRRVVARELWA